MNFHQRLYVHHRSIVRLQKNDPFGFYNTNASHSMNIFTEQMHDALQMIDDQG